MLRTNVRVTPSTIQDEEGNWIRLVAIDAHNLSARPATDEEIKEAKNKPADTKPDPKAPKIVKPDTCTEVSTPNLPPPDYKTNQENLKALVDEINLRDAAKRDEEASIAAYKLQLARADEKAAKKPAGPQL